MNIGNYQLLEQIGATAGGTLHLARQVQDGGAALLKLPARDNAADGLRHEYALLQSLDIPEILKPIALHEDGARLALVLEPFAGECLEAVLARQPRFPLPVALIMASQLVRALAALHASGIAHRDLRPTNILLAHDGVQVKLADLSRAASRDGATSLSQTAAGDWAYVSPEQTGRMNRQADYRTDFYSLGILLYRLLTGQLPFQADDPLEWVHCHLARMPVAPHQLMPDLPQAVSDVVLKLLAKVPEERYQSASGLLTDLEHCLDQWQSSGKIAPFALGMRDVSDRFQIPHKLYGREQEKAALLAAFETVATTGTPMLVTVAGYSGVGKSALVHALQQPIVEKHGYFISGKFDQYKRDIPYATLAQAFDLLLRQILGESDANIAHWRDTIREALGPVAQLMVNLIPQLELVIGPQPPVPDLPPQEAQGRFQLVFRRFLDVFARQEHPLVLFLDDLQWVDTGTLAVLADLATHSDVHYLLLVGAYRDNEVDSSHPLIQRLEAISQAGGVVQNIVLAPLTLGDVAQLIAEALHCPFAEAQPLAQLILDKTGGNPFFTRQFLAALAEEKLLQFDAAHGAWRWNLPRIQAKGYTDNVVDLMVGKLARLPQESQDALIQFACLGNASDAATLGLVLGQSVETVHALLWEAERAGLVYRQENSYAFLHDRIQEAAYSQIPESVRDGIHLSIGRLLASGLPPGAVADRIFEVVNQLNRGSALVESQEERERIAELNLLAGQRAKAATAYASALSYLAAGAALLPPDCWERRYDLSFVLNLHRAECEFLTGALAIADARLTELACRAANLLDLAAVACMRINLFMTTQRPDRGVEVALDYLRRIGVKWTAQPSKDDLWREYERIWQQIGDRPIEALLDLPPMSNRIACATMEVLTVALPPAMLTDLNLCCLIICRMVNLSLEHGNSDASCHAYVTLAMVLGPVFDDYSSAFRFGKLGLDLVQKNRLNRFEAHAYLFFAGLVSFWMTHVRTSISLLLHSREVAQQVGELTVIGYSYIRAVTALLATGDPLAEVQREAEAGFNFAQQARFDFIIDVITVDLGLIRTLRGLTSAFGSFDDTGFDESRFEQHLEDPLRAMAACWYWIRKLQARFLAGDQVAAIAAAAKVQSLLWTSPYFLEAVEYRYFAALVHAALYDTASTAERDQHMQALTEHHAHLRKWAENCPENFANRAALVDAELARIEGRYLDAMRFYEQATCSARDNGFVHNEAIAHELAARFYLARGLTLPGNAYLEQARACYARWGADGKVRQLEEQYSQLRARTERTAAAPDEAETRLDLLSVAKASQAISGQILLDELIDILMRLMLETAGAQTGSLLLAQGDELALVAEAKVEQQTVQVRQHAGQALSQGQLPLTILQYVRRSREPVLLMEASAPHPFATEPYFAQQHPQSVLCLPILRQSVLVGLLYLENRLATHAFPPERVQVLELLASQAAISIDNARLYADVRDSHARVRRLVESNIIGILFWDLSGNITDANDAFLRMTGYSRDDLKSGALRWTEITPPEYRDSDARALDELKRTGSAPPFEKEFLCKDGGRIPILLGATLFEQSQETGVAFALDLSERKRAEAEREARHAAEAANRAKSTFLANMSHELRTPLNAMLGYAQILQEERNLTERQISGVTTIRQSGEHLLMLITDLLDLARIESGKFELVSDDVNLEDFYKVIANMIRVRAEQKGLSFILDIPPDLPSTVIMDEKRLRQVLLNLLGNAVKYTDKGHIILRIRRLPSEEKEARLLFEVQDTGIGISADQSETIFQPFEQVGDTQRRQGGTGLGLSISRSLIRLMGGDIQVESRSGLGSLFRFEVSLPVKDVQAAAHKVEIRRIIGYEGERKAILIVDDNASNRTVLTDLLQRLDFQVHLATNGKDGLEQAQAVRPDLILMDMVMPAMDGIEATRRIRTMPSLKETPVILLSASAMPEDQARRLSTAANAFMLKPIDQKRLVQYMASLLQMKLIYEEQAEETDAGEGELIVPPPEELEYLYQAALIGNMRHIGEQADRLERLAAQYRPFASKVRDLAKNYQSKAILEMMKLYRNKKPS